MEAFFEEWMRRLEQLFGELISARSGDVDLRDLVNRTLAHFKGYYLERRRLADRDVLQVYSPQWLTPFERTFLWIAGWRPSLTFRLLDAGGGGEEVAATIREMEAEVAAEEERLSGEMASLQEAMAAPAVLAVLSRTAELRNGEAPREEDEALRPLLHALRLLLERADNLRVKVVKGLVRILSPEKMVELLVAATHLHLRLRAWGMRFSAGAAAAEAPA